MTDTTTQSSPSGDPASGGMDPLVGFAAPAAGQQLNIGAANPPTTDPLSPDFDDPYYDPDEWERLSPRTNFLFRLGLVVTVILLIGAFIFTKANSWVDRQIDPPGPQGGELVVEIPSGASDSDVMRILAESGVIPNSTVAQYWMRFNDVGDFQAGDYLFRSSVSPCQKAYGPATCATSCSTISSCSIPTSSPTP